MHYIIVLCVQNNYPKALIKCYSMIHKSDEVIKPQSHEKVGKFPSYRAIFRVCGVRESEY